jgi:tRNA pseudouridine55 synthase
MSDPEGVTPNLDNESDSSMVVSTQRARPLRLPRDYSQPGILLLDKAAGVSSAKAIQQVQDRLGIKKIGHAGTLDPFATGLLVVLLNGATRLMDYARIGRKRYSGEIAFGMVSDSDDLTGELRPTGAPPPSEEAVFKALPSFIGEISQVPPQISAVHVQGRRAYALAREGLEVTIEPRTVTVESFELSRIAADRYSFVVTCSGGTYIRSLARDLGAVLGCGGYLAALRREGSTPLSVARATRVEDLSVDRVLPWDTLFPTAPRVQLESSDMVALQRGQLGMLLPQLASLDVSDGGVCIVVAESEQAPVALLLFRAGRWQFGVNFVAR